ncbi:hypothetical protein [Roseimicrobium gellanilyticum]|uniref:hypothetical protein n=1 Tax=Roseimicrobium gellanilyticum TaxID=748857 RepID=UPI000DEA8744|nr:hypothetical protein [Roseimicrobium gellanilyticum]
MKTAAEELKRLLPALREDASIAVPCRLQHRHASVFAARAEHAKGSLAKNGPGMSPEAEVALRDYTALRAECQRATLDHLIEMLEGSCGHG